MCCVTRYMFPNNKVDTYLFVSFQSTFSGDRWCICILCDFLLLFFFSKGSVFNTTQICCCCSENSRNSGILWTMLLFLRDQYTCLHTDHFIQFNLTIKHKHLWRTFLAFKIIFAGGCAYDDRKRSYQLTICFQNILQ